MGSKKRVVTVGGAQAPGAVVERVLEGYRSYLLLERGVSETTAAVYEPRARRFLSQRGGLEDLGLDRLSAADVSGFLARECPARAPGEAKMLVVVVRSVLRYLHVAGLIAAPLEWAVPGVAAVRDRSLPRGLEPSVVAALLSSCDRRRAVGRRDYAILLLLVRLGLRSSEVAWMALDDVNWRAGEILIHSKGGREDLVAKLEALLQQLGGESADGSRGFDHVDDNIHVRGGARHRDTVLGRQDVHHLPADQVPVGAAVREEVQQDQPALFLGG
ncbi:MAG TPA: tyrosine-type recombinase/integrase [Dermatophilaceae bacterium]